MDYQAYPRRVQQEAAVMPRGEPDDSFYLFYKIEPVVVLWGNSRRLHADELNHAGRLMKLLNHCSVHEIPIRAMFCRDRVLSRSSIRALNCYLRHAGMKAFAKTGPSYAWSYRTVTNKYEWADFQELLNLRWTP